MYSFFLSLFDLPISYSNYYTTTCILWHLVQWSIWYPNVKNPINVLSLFSSMLVAVLLAWPHSSYSWSSACSPFSPLYSSEQWSCGLEQKGFCLITVIRNTWMLLIEILPIQMTLTTFQSCSFGAWYIRLNAFKTVINQ